jgi:SAM-dependent methyltransferase
MNKEETNQEEVLNQEGTVVVTTQQDPGPEYDSTGLSAEDQFDPAEEERKIMHRFGDNTDVESINNLATIAEDNLASLIDKESDEELDPLYLQNDPRVVGYNNVDDQKIMYDFILSNFDSTSESILDLGCGRGDLLRHAEQIYGVDLNYRGVDLNKQLIDIAKEMSPEKKDKFTNTNWFQLDGNYASDWVLNINSSTILYEPEGPNFDQVQALRNTIIKMMELADTGIVISLLSTLAQDAYDDSYLIYDPIETLDWALNEYGGTGGNVKLDHTVSDALFILTIYK